MSGMRPALAVTLPPAVRAQILRHARGSPQEEVCGLVGGQGNCLAQAYPVPNVAADKTRFFEMDGTGQVAAMRDMAGARQELRAIYHSHPRGPAYPSPTDLARHAYPDCCYLVVAPREPAERCLRAFVIDGDQVQEMLIASV